MYIVLMTSYKHKVQYYETDKMGIVHHSNYIRWMEEARVDFLDKINWSYDQLEKVGLVSPVLSLNIEYDHPTYFGDEVSIDVEILELKMSKMKVGYKMINEEGKTVALSESSHGFLLSSGRPSILKRDFPGLYEALMAHVRKDSV
ncbi:MAG: acyl-CoA thioesterase [Spirochaetales bacterium]|nr:acyl-CoA thioesterase [Spirochaetales bacterium]